MTKEIWKDKHGRWFCQLSDDKYPYSKVTAMGIDSADAEKRAIELRKEIIEQQLRTKCVFMI